MIKAVIFDLDGTIVDFNLDYKSVRAEVIQTLNKEGIPSSILFMNESIFNMLKKAEIYVRNNDRKDIDITRVKKEVLSVVNRHELQAAHATSLMPSILEALKTLNKMKMKLAIFTVNGEKSASYILRSFRLKRFFEVVITRESVSAIKPNPAHLEATLKALNVEPEEAIVVGDSKGDMACAQELNVIAVGVPTGISSPKELTNAGATHLISSAIHLPELIQQLNSGISTP